MFHEQVNSFHILFSSSFPTIAIIGYLGKIQLNLCESEWNGEDINNGRKEMHIIELNISEIWKGYL